ncbi:unnamed protein product [Diamesa hyperborea]
MKDNKLVKLLGVLVLFYIGTHHESVNGAAVFSIDLGNEWMKVGIVSPGLPMEIALNKESKRKTPSVIAFRDKARLFGEDAVNLAARFPASSYGYLMDLLGKQIDNPVVDLFKQRFPYYNIEADKERNTVIFVNGEERYTVEELVAQMLLKGQEMAQDATQQNIQECVLIVPGFFGQPERNALLSAAKLANLKVLQLINDYTAVGLNYGIFQRKHFNETAQYYMFYDMGAYKTTATIVSFQLVKDKQTKELLPVVQVVGVGYDRTLGGLEMQLRMRDYLAKAFNDMKKTTKNVYENPRAMAKLFKEAGRVKNILSANNEHYAQIEGLLDEQDFKFMVTREKFEDLCKDLFARVAEPVKRAVTTAGVSLDLMNQVIIFGGATRTPKVQEILKETIGQELGKNLNADEAATMGAAYRAADLATGFKVKKFIIKDAVLFPIQVVFEREGETGGKKPVVRTLFGAMNAYPQKKVITFNKHKEDFDFTANYADLEFLGEKEIAQLGSLNITKVSLKKVAKMLNDNVKENVESKGIKAHFAIDESGLFSLAHVELILEKTNVAGEEKDDEGTLSKLGSTISKLFSGEKDDNKVETDSDDKTEEPSKVDADDSAETNNETGSNTDDNVKPIKEEAEKNATAGDKSDKPKVTVIKEQVPSETENLFSKPLEGKQFKESSKRIDEHNEIENQKLRRESAINSLETYVIEAQRRLEQKEYSECATKKELVDIKKECVEISDWLYDDGVDAAVEVFEEKLVTLTKTVNEVYARHWEHSERPEALKALHSMINGSEHFLATARNLTKDKAPEKDVFTDKEVENLAKAIQETIDWREKENEAQMKLAKNEQVRLTVKAMTDKMAYLDREVKYLVNKIKAWRPKEKPKEKKKKAPKKTANATATDEKTEETTGETIETAQEEPTIELEEQIEQKEDIDATPSPEEPLGDAEHTEL